MGFVFFLVVVFIIVLIFRSSKRKNTITTIDPETGEKSVETFVTNTSSIGSTVSKIVSSVIVIIVGLIVWFFYTYA